MSLSLACRVLVTALVVLATSACSPRPFDTTDARLIAESSEGEMLYVKGGYLWDENVYLVQPNWTYKRVGTNGALFDYTFFGAISDAHLVWIVDDYDYPSDGAVHVVFYDRETEIITRWDYELASDAFSRGFFIAEDTTVLCGDTIHWKQRPVFSGEASLDVWLSAMGDLRWTELDSDESELWMPECS